MIEKIDGWTWPDSLVAEQDCFNSYDREPDLTRKNLIFLAEKLNEVIEAVNNQETSNDD